VVVEIEIDVDVDVEVETESVVETEDELLDPVEDRLVDVEAGDDGRTIVPTNGVGI
jgi:hypothetical protein